MKEMTPKIVSYQLYVLMAITIVMFLVGYMLEWDIIDDTITQVWLGSLYAASRVCDALQLVWEKLPTK